MPTLPAVAIQVLDMCQDPDTGLMDLEKVIRTDAVLVGKLLQVANSPMMGGRRKVTTLGQVLSLLGMNSVKTITLSYSLLGASGAGKNPEWQRQFWKRSAVAAAAARCLASGQLPTIVEECYLVALLQDIGMLPLANVLGASYFELGLDPSVTHQALADYEKERVGADHASVGQWLTRQWALADHISQAVSLSHGSAAELKEAQANSEEPALMSIVAASGLVADCWMSVDNNTIVQARQFCSEVLDLSRSAFDEMMASLKEQVNASLSLMDQPEYDEDEMEGIVQQAREALVMMSISQEIQKQEAMVSAEERVKEAKEAATRDPLTGLLNRAAMDEFLDRAFEAARSGQALALVVVDVDFFKKINDTYGHVAGDAVLKRLGGLLNDTVRPTDLAARFGGEEFLLALTGTDVVGAGIVAERIRSRLADTHIDLGDGKTIQITASFGCAAFDRDTHTQSTSLFEEADKALYRAKSLGRNRVCKAEPQVEGASAQAG